MGIFSKIFGQKTPSAPPVQDRLQHAKNLYDQGEREAALRVLTEEIHEHPNNAIAYVHRGGIYNSLRRYDESVVDYTRALELNPDDAMTYYYRGNSYHMGDKPWEALADFDRCLELNPGNMRARENQRFMQIYIEKHKIPCPEVATQPKPPVTVTASGAAVSPTPQRAGEFLAQLSREERTAVSNLDRSFYEALIAAKMGGYTNVSFASLDPSVNQERAGNLLWKLGIPDLQRLAESVSYTIRADAAARSDIDEAARLYQKAFELNPYDEIPIMSYAICLSRQGQIREAISWCEKAVRANPNSERARRNLQYLKSLV